MIMNASNFTRERLSSRGSMEFASNVLFVGDLASFCTEAHIESIFRNEGFRIFDAKLIRGRQSALSLNYGFVQMRTAEEAMGAIAALDNRLFYGRTIRVSWAKPNSKGSKSHDIVNSIHVKFQALIPNFYVTEETLRDVFSAFGIVTDAWVKRSNATPLPGVRDSGYGFVHFAEGDEGVASAFKSIASISQIHVIDNVEYVCEPSRNLLKQLQVFDTPRNLRTSPPDSARSRNIPIDTGRLRITPPDSTRLRQLPNASSSPSSVMNFLSYDSENDMKNFDANVRKFSHAVDPYYNSHFRDVNISDPHVSQVSRTNSSDLPIYRNHVLTSTTVSNHITGLNEPKFSLYFSSYTERFSLKAGCSFIILNEDTGITREQSSFIISQYYPSSIQPEYEALSEGLTRALESGIRKIHVMGNSELLHIQLNGGSGVDFLQTSYRVVDPLFAKVKKLSCEFSLINMELISVQQNAQANEMAKSVYLKSKQSDINGQQQMISYQEKLISTM